jgi:ABC-type nitrate/sulfonate/bicarbonate transport system substrate-binding protein
MYRILVADLDSPSYFVATAAAALGFFKEEDLDVEIVFRALDGPERLRNGTLDFFGGPAYAATRAFSDWKGAKLLCALSQYSYWFLAVRADLDVKRGDVNALKGLRITTSLSWPGMGLKHMLAESGIDLGRDRVQIIPPLPPSGEKGWMGKIGIDAIEQGIADAFWGNGMRVALGEQLGVAKRHLDLRRGDGPSGARFYNFAALTASERLCNERPEVVAGAVRAIVRTQKALRADPSLASKVGEQLFPPDEAALIAGLVERDSPFYDATITEEAIDGLNKFSQAMGLISGRVAYDQVVATQMSDYWK